MKAAEAAAATGERRGTVCLGDIQMDGGAETETNKRKGWLCSAVRGFVKICGNFKRTGRVLIL